MRERGRSIPEANELAKGREDREEAGKVLGRVERVGRLHGPVDTSTGNVARPLLVPQLAILAPLAHQVAKGEPEHAAGIARLGDLGGFIGVQWEGRADVDRCQDLEGAFQGLAGFHTSGGRSILGHDVRDSRTWLSSDGGACLQEAPQKMALPVDRRVGVGCSSGRGDGR